MPACNVPVNCQKGSIMHARQSGSPGNSAGVISAFVDSIDSQIIVRMIRE